MPVWWYPISDVLFACGPRSYPPNEQEAEFLEAATVVRSDQLSAKFEAARFDCGYARSMNVST